LQLTTAIASNDKNYTTIEGLAYMNDGQLIKTARRNVMKDLDSLPMPAWDIIDMAPYKKMWLKSTGTFYQPGNHTRVPLKCNWCAKPIYGNRYNTRSPENVVKELKVLKEKFQFEHVWFCDDI